jgi:hypothetical protein
MEEKELMENTENNHTRKQNTARAVRTQEGKAQ